MNCYGVRPAIRWEGADGADRSGAVPWHHAGGAEVEAGILHGMTVTTIKVPIALRNRLHRLAASDGLTLAQEIEKLIEGRAPRVRPTVGGFRSNQPMTAEQIDAALSDGFGE